MGGRTQQLSELSHMQTVKRAHTQTIAVPRDEHSHQVPLRYDISQSIGSLARSLARSLSLSFSRCAYSFAATARTRTLHIIKQIIENSLKVMTTTTPTPTPPAVSKQQAVFGADARGGATRSHPNKHKNPVPIRLPNDCRIYVGRAIAINSKHTPTKKKTLQYNATHY